MAKKKADKPAVSPERDEEIRRDARSGTNWASLVGYGPSCLCGAFPGYPMTTSQGQVVPKGVCHRHGTIQPSRTTR